MKFLFGFVTVICTSFAVEVYGDDFALVPDRDGNLYEVNVDEALSEDYPYFPISTAVHFELFTLSNPTEPQLITHNNETSLRNSHFNPDNPTRIMIHGWNGRGLMTPIFTAAYFEKGHHNVNFIAVNWRNGSDTINYIGARRRVTRVGPYVGNFIDFLVRCGNLNLKNLTVIGYSLGAHVAGIAGKNVVTGRIAKIVGLDPALPLFRYQNADDRLAVTDAEYVEVIHTCAGTLGFLQPLGNASFYPNGGRSQPGCRLDLTGACAHRRSYEIFVEGIHQETRFYGFQCDSLANVLEGRCEVVNELVEMGGEPGAKSANGIFYLETNNASRYSLGRDVILPRIQFAYQIL